jgi:hypothetical protein
MEKVARVFADRVVSASGANRRLARPACVIASAFLVWPPSRCVLCRDNSPGGLARLLPDRQLDRVAVGLRAAFICGSETD